MICNTSGSLAMKHPMTTRTAPALVGPDPFIRRFFYSALLVLLAGCGQVSVQQSPQSPSPGQSARASSTSDRSGARYDLEADEPRGGHTVKKHVGQSDAELRTRLAREHDISAASTWTDLDTAEKTVAEAVHAEQSRIDRWEDRGARRPNLALHYDAGRVIGRSMYRGSDQAEPVTRAVIVLRADGPGFFVLTTYPEER
jgi:hypothetical protein